MKRRAFLGLSLLAGFGLATLLFFTVGGIAQLGAALLVGAGAQALNQRATAPLEREVALYDGDGTGDDYDVGDEVEGPFVAADAW